MKNKLIKRFLSIVLSLILASTILGCNRDTISTNTNTEVGSTNATTKNTDGKYKIIEPTKEDLLALGEKQTADMIEVLKSHNLQTQVIALQGLLRILD